MRKSIDIVVINWNSGKETLEAIKPYLNYRDENMICNVIVIDNNSFDNSLFLFKDKIKNVISNKQNIGFGAACNQASQISSSDYILLLNPDTRSSINVLKELINVLEKNERYAIAGPQQRNEKGDILKSCGRFPTFKTSLYELVGLSKIFPQFFTPSPIMTDWNHLRSEVVDHVIGSYMLIKQLVIRKIGFMDDQFFLYLEDLDFSKRVSNAEYKSYFLATSWIIHEGGGSGHNIKAQRLFYILDSRRIYWGKYFTSFQVKVLIGVSLFFEPLLRIIDSIFKERKTNIISFYKAYKLYLNKIKQDNKII